MSNNRHAPKDRFGFPVPELTIEKMGYYFYERPRKSIEYSYVPGQNSKINTTRLIQQQPFYEHETISYQREMKKIIFNDWRLPHLIGRWRGMYLRHLHNLFFRFEFYVCDGKKLIKVDDIVGNDTKLSFENLFHFFKFLDTHTLRNIIKKAGFANDQVYIFQYQNGSFYSPTIRPMIPDEYGLDLDIDDTGGELSYISDSPQGHIEFQPSSVFEAIKIFKIFFLRDLFFIPEDEVPYILHNTDEASFDTLDLTLRSAGHGFCEPDKIKRIIHAVTKKFKNCECILVGHEHYYENMIVHLPPEFIANLKKIIIEVPKKLSEIIELYQFIRKFNKNTIELQFVTAGHENLRNCINPILRHLAKNLCPEWKLNEFLAIQSSDEFFNFYYPYEDFDPLDLPKYQSLLPQNHFFHGVYSPDNQNHIDINDDSVELLNLLPYMKWIDSLVYSDDCSDDLKPLNLPLNPHIHQLRTYSDQRNSKTISDMISTLPALHSLYLHFERMTRIKNTCLGSIPDSILKNIQTLILDKSIIDLKQLTLLLSKMSSLMTLRLQLELNLNIKENDLTSFKNLCPHLQYLEMTLIITDFNENSFLRFIQLLPKELKNFHLLVNLKFKHPVTRLFYDHKIHTLAHHIEAMINNQFTRLTKSKIIVGSDTVNIKNKMEYNGIVPLNHETDIEPDNEPGQFFEPNEAAKLYFEDRHTRRALLDLDEKNQTRPIIFNRTFFKKAEVLAESKNITDIFSSFQKLRDAETPLLFYQEKIELRPGKPDFLISSGPNDVILVDDKGKKLIATDYPIEISYSNYYGVYALQLLAHENQNRTVTIALIYHHFPQSYPLNPLHNPKDTSAIASLKFFDDGKLNYKTLTTPLIVNPSVSIESADDCKEALYPEHRLFSALIRYFLSFRRGKLEDSEENLMTQLLQQRKGLCAHRARIFYLLVKNLGLKKYVRILEDPYGAHEWLEIYYPPDKKWYTVELRNEMASPPDETLAMDEEDDDIDDVKMEVKPEFKLFPDHKAEIEKKEGMNILEKIKKLIPQLPTGTPHEFFAALDEKFSSPTTSKQCLVALPQEDSRFQFYNHLSQRQIHRKRNLCIIDNLQSDGAKTLHVDDEGKSCYVPTERQQFLATAQAGDVLVLNFIDMKPQHVAYNSVVDSYKRMLENTPIPAGVEVIVVTDEENLSHLRQDVKSRFQRMKGLIVHLPEWEIETPMMPEEKDAFVIDLKGDVNFEALLFGTHYFLGTQPQLKHGILSYVKQLEHLYRQQSLIGLHNKINKIEDTLRQLLGLEKTTSVRELIKKPFLFINPPNNPEFETFINTKKYFFNGKTYSFDQAFFTDKHLLTYNTECIISESKETTEWFLNVNNLSYLSERSIYNASLKKYQIAPSILDSLPNGATIWITETLSDGEWSYFLQLCHDKNKQFKFKKTLNAKLPDELESLIPEVTLSSSNPSCEIVSTSDTGKMAAHYFLQESKNSVIYSLNPQTGLELLEKPLLEKLSESSDTEMAVMDEKIHPAETQCELPIIHLQLGQIIADLEKGKHVILKADNISKSLQQALAGLFLNPPFIMFKNQKHFIKSGKLIILTDLEQNFDYIPSPDNKPQEPDAWQVLKMLSGKSSQALETFKTALSELKLEDEPSFEVLNQLLNDYLLRGPIALQCYKNFLDPTLEALPALSYQERMSALLQLLEKERTIFLAGPTGTGKSSTVLFDLPKLIAEQTSNDLKLFVGLSNIQQWATSPLPQQIKILFIDEANLNPDIDCLTGIHDPIEPHIILNGERIVLSPRHKIIFAGNLNYEGREKNALFEGAHILFFEELSFKEKFEKFVLPILAKTPKLTPDDLTCIYQIFSAAEQKALTTEDSKLCTTRNLENMALYFTQLINHKSVSEAALLAAELSIRYLLPNSEPLPLNESHESIKASLLQKNFLVTPTHYPTLHVLDSMLTLRNLTASDPLLQRKGTRGVLLEGPSGIGKSNIAEKYLQSQGFVEVDPDSIEPVTATQCYCILKPTQPEKMLDVLNRAFHEGWIVIIDEIDSLVIEEYLNAFMSGVDLEGNKAAKPGFCVIGTLNGIELPKRQILSPAFKNRFIQVALNPYSLEEVLQIVHLYFPALPQVKQSLLAQCYMLSQTSNDPLTMRDILDIGIENFNQQQFEFIQSLIKSRAPDTKPAAQNSPAISLPRDGKDASDSTSTLSLTPMSDVDDKQHTLTKQTFGLATISLFAKDQGDEKNSNTRHVVAAAISQDAPNVNSEISTRVPMSDADEVSNSSSSSASHAPTNRKRKECANTVVHQSPLKKSRF